MTLKEELLREKCKGAFPFWGGAIAWFSIFYGIFLLIFGDYMHSLFSKLFDVVPDGFIATVLITCAIIKLVGIYSKNKKLMRVGIVALSAVWTAVEAVYLVFSFGIGYPSPSFLFVGLIVVICYRVAKKGDFG